MNSMAPALEDDVGIIVVSEGDVFTPQLPSDRVVWQRLRIGRPWGLDYSEDVFPAQELPSTNLGLEAEIEAWEAASDEALEDFEDSISE